MKKRFKIADKWVGGENDPCFVIAEMSANHNQNFKRAEELIKIAAEAGADAVKLQTYTPSTLTINSSREPFIVRSYNRNWDKQTLYGLYKKAYMPWSWQPKLKKIAESYDIILFSTAYDETAVDFLEKMDVPAYKIASFEMVDIELLKKVAKTNKPVILSKGMASLEETELAVSTLRRNGALDIALLHCVSSYPVKPEDMNLATIPDIKKRFGVVAGLSDHTLGIAVAVTSIALGARIIEKHFTLKRSDKGVDSSFSLEPKELKQLVRSVREAEKAIGKIQYGPVGKEKMELSGRRSLFVVKSIRAGEKFTRQHIRSIRPGFGLAPKFLLEVLGKKAKGNIMRGTPLMWDLVDKGKV